MQSASKHSLVQVALVAVVIALGWFVFNGSDDPQPEPPEQAQHVDRPAVDTMPAATGIDQLEVDEQPVEDMHPKRTAKRIISNSTSTASSSSSPVEPAPVGNWENEYEASDALEAALMGDVNEAIAISDLVLQCRAGYENESIVQNNLDKMTRTAKQGRPLPGLFMASTGATREFKTIAEYESYTWSQYTKCQTAKSLFDKNLRKRLQDMAEAGNVHARYMYAMWVPTQSGMTNDDMLDWMTYQSHAMDYTWQNISEGEPLGLLAYGRSLEQSGHVYFTPRHTRYGPAFIMAAYKCGLKNQTIDQKVGNMTAQWKQRNQVQAATSSDSMSDMIVKTFCH